MVEKIQALSEELLKLIGIDAKITVTENDEESYEVNLNTLDETGLLIGFRGENINSIQTVLGMMVKGITGNWVRIIVNIGDCRQKQEQKLEILADQTADRAIETSEPQPIYNLTPSQRRIIHMYLSKRTDVETESKGDDPARFLIVKPNQTKEK